MNPRRLDSLLALAAVVAGWLRGWGLPLPTDHSVHLVRIGQGLIRQGMDIYAQPPPGSGASLLGSLATGIGAWFSTGPEDLARPAGTVLLGIAAGVLSWTVTRIGGRLLSALAVALLLAPPAFASTFAGRPDAALGGILILLGLYGAVRGVSPAGIRSDGGNVGGGTLAAVWIGGLATPAAWIAALVLQATAPRSWRHWAAMPAVLAAAAGLAWLVPDGSRAEFTQALWSGWDFSGDGWPSTLVAVRKVWLFGALLALPLVLLGTDPRHRRAVAAWAAAALAAGLFASAGEFRETTAALAPGACFLLALLARSTPDPAGAAGSRRVVLAALAVPLILMIAQLAEVGQWRRSVREAVAREAQIAKFLDDTFPADATLWAERTGTLFAYTERPVLPIRAELPETGGPSLVLFRYGLNPTAPGERTLFGTAAFHSRFTPLHFRRGLTRGIQDAVWTLRREPVPIADFSPDYPLLLRQGWGHYAVENYDAARRAFQQACAWEPPGIGVAHEWLGLTLELQMDPRAAETVFLQARHRDPTTVRARGHLADRAISRGKIGAADSLIAEAMAASEQEPELWGVSARFHAATGDPDAAMKDSEKAIYLNPRNGKLLANHGILLWSRGDAGGARDFWRLAATWNEDILRYLGNFEAAPDSAPAPPLIPVFSMEGFRPPLDERPGPDGTPGGDDRAAPNEGR